MDWKKQSALNSRVWMPSDALPMVQKSLSSVEFGAYLAPDGTCEKKPSKLSEIAFHPARPWVAACDPKGNGIVWNHQTKEVVFEFSLEVEASGDGLDDPESPKNSSVSITKIASPSAASSLVKTFRSKNNSFGMFFYDHEAITERLQSSMERFCFDEWLILLTSTHVCILDINQNSGMKLISPEEMQRHSPCSIESLPYGYLAIGCSDGTIRIWNPRIWKFLYLFTTNSSKDIQQLLLLPSFNGHTTNAGLTCCLASASLDGKLALWSIACFPNGCESSKLCEFDLKESFKAFDTSNGINELKFHQQQNLLSAISRDGNGFFFDVSPVLNNKPMQLLGILPNGGKNVLNALVMAGPRRSSLLLVTCGNAATGSALTCSELVVKGRLMIKENVPSPFNEFGISSSWDTKDLKDLNSLLFKKLKLLSLVASGRRRLGANLEFGCVTNYGLFVMSLNCFAGTSSCTVIPRVDRADALAFALPGKLCMRLMLQTNEPATEELQLVAVAKDQDQTHKLQLTMDATLPERVRTPSVAKSPDGAYLSALVPGSGHAEILVLEPELKNQKAITLNNIFSGNAISLAWHSSLNRFGVLVPQDPNSRRLTKLNSQTSAPRRRGFRFGRSDDAADNSKQKMAIPSAVSLTLYEISTDGQVEMLEDGIASDERLVYLFSGPLLGIVRQELPDDMETGGTGGSGASGGPGASAGGGGNNASALESSSSKASESESSFRIRARSDSTGTTSSSSNLLGPSGAVEIVDELEISRKAWVEFYDWGQLTKNPSDKSSFANVMPRVGGVFECPLAVEWEKLNKFCVLVYGHKLVICARTSSTELEVLHDIPVASEPKSVKWHHHALFVVTINEEIKVFFVCKTRFFAFDLATRDASTLQSSITTVAGLFEEFPKPQAFPYGASSIVGVRNEQLILVSNTQVLFTLGLSNRVLKFCMLVAVGKPEVAVGMAKEISPDLSDWLTSFLEAFGFISMALQLPHTSRRLRINLCIKHQHKEALIKLLQEPQPDSKQVTGVSLFQKGCTALHRMGYDQALVELFPKLLTSERFHDAVFVASLLQQQELLKQALREQQRYGVLVQLELDSNAQNQDQLVAKWIQQTRQAALWKEGLEQAQLEPITSR